MAGSRWLPLVGLGVALAVPSPSYARRDRLAEFLGVTRPVSAALARVPYRPPTVLPSQAPGIRPGHDPAIDALGADPESVYYDPNVNAIYAGNEWDRTSRGWVPTAKVPPFIRAHETGHALDRLYLTDADRERLRAAMRLKTKKPWFGNPEDENRTKPTPAERFADWYASIARDINMPGSKKFKSTEYDTQYGGRRAWKEFRAILEEVRKRHGLSDYS